MQSKSRVQKDHSTPPESAQSDNDATLGGLSSDLLRTFNAQLSKVEAELDKAGALMRSMLGQIAECSTSQADDDITKRTLRGFEHLVYEFEQSSYRRFTDVTQTWFESILPLLKASSGAAAAATGETPFPQLS